MVSEALWEMYEAGGDERIGALARSAAGLEADLAAFRQEVEAARDALESGEKLPRWQPAAGGGYSPAFRLEYMREAPKLCLDNFGLSFDVINDLAIMNSAAAASISKDNPLLSTAATNIAPGAKGIGGSRPALLSVPERVGMTLYTMRTRCRFVQTARAYNI